MPDKTTLPFASSNLLPSLLQLLPYPCLHTHHKSIIYIKMCICSTQAQLDGLSEKIPISVEFLKYGYSQHNNGPNTQFFLQKQLFLCISLHFIIFSIYCIIIWSLYIAFPSLSSIWDCIKSWTLHFLNQNCLYLSVAEQMNMFLCCGQMQVISALANKTQN